jgi:hydroxymethylpyrimidine pyrophosphatase-like HAD family hydrolase
MQLVASDLDGTIVRGDGSIGVRTLTALASCERCGVEVLFVTGRPPRWMPSIADATGHRGIAVCGNGAVVYDLESGGTVVVGGLDPLHALAVGETLRGILPGAVFALETPSGLRREPGFVPYHPDAHRVSVGPLPEILGGDPLIKVLCRVEGMDADSILGLARPALAGLAEPVHSDSAGSMIEIAALGVTKASTLALVAAERGIAPGAVVAFGDMPNDVPMLRWAGRGYAMADGHPEALAAADAIAPACAEDGVAQVLEGLLGELAAGEGPPVT